MNKLILFDIEFLFIENRNVFIYLEVLIYLDGYYKLDDFKNLLYKMLDFWL